MRGEFIHEIAYRNAYVGDGSRNLPKGTVEKKILRAATKVANDRHLPSFLPLQNSTSLHIKNLQSPTKSTLMASFLRRFTTSASAGKTMYFSLAVASALPMYAVLNENSPPAPPNSRANVFVSHFDVISCDYF